MKIRKTFFGFLFPETLSCPEPYFSLHCMDPRMSSNIISWKHHPKNLYNVCRELYQSQSERFTDVVVVCGQKRFPCHRALLSASSDFFSVILEEHPPWIEPIIIVDNVEESFMEAILNYLYTGIITVDAMKAGNFLQVCAYFKIKGLMTYDILCQEEQILEEEKATITPVQVPQDVIILHTSPPPVEEVIDGDEPGEEELPGGGVVEETYEPEDLLVFLKAQAEQSTPLVKSQVILKMDKNLMIGLDSYDEDQGSVPDTSQPSEIVMDSADDDGDDDADVDAETDDDNNKTPEEDAEKNEEFLRYFPQSGKRVQRAKPGASSDIAADVPEKKRRTHNGYTEEQMNKSMEAVCKGDLNLSSASLKFNVPKSVLWRKLQKRPDYVAHPIDKQRQAAKEAMIRGESTRVVSKKFNVPLATLYRDKQKLVEEGQLGHRRRSKGEAGDAMQQAVQACEEGMAQSEAARLFKVSKSTLWRRIKKGH